MKNSIFIALFLFASFANAQKTFNSEDFVGSWVAHVDEFGSKETIFCEVFGDGTMSAIFFYGQDRYQVRTGKWWYRNNILYQTDDNIPNCQQRGRIKWVDRNKINLTIIYNCDSRYTPNSYTRTFERYR